MNYHNITKDDMLNGDGLRVVLWVAGCTHHCANCQNPITWDVAGGLPFDEAAEKELFEALREQHIYVRYFPKDRIDNFLRITIGTREEMQKFIDFLKDYLK